MLPPSPIDQTATALADLAVHLFTAAATTRPPRYLQHQGRPLTERKQPEGGLRRAQTPFGYADHG
ncbi:hypothetical protein AB0B85_33035, partial [Micromonospora sp. NPDC049044]